MHGQWTNEPRRIFLFCFSSICLVPKVFAIVFNIVKKFLDEYTLSKIMIFKNDSKKWLPKMLEHVDRSQIPKYYGGTQTDEDGDPKCTHKVNDGWYSNVWSILW